ncbi:MAG: hypothetical protein HLUCCO16_20045 [Phormidium sp. OSCR]|nr:MAG: hypothetical protein HLUCCO16_20045 [Phormidium sp. OSCR]
MTINMNKKLSALKYLPVTCLSLACMTYNLSSQAQSNPNCSSPQTQAEMNICARQSLERADSELNRVYSQVINNQSATHRELLIDAQLDWIDYRDATCELAGDGVRGGSLQPLYITTCHTTLTETRTAELAAYAENRYPRSTATRFSDVEPQYRSALSRRTRQSNSSLVAAADNAWQNYRNSVCEFEQRSWGSPALGNCQTRLTEQWIQQLQGGGR